MLRNEVDRVLINLVVVLQHEARVPHGIYKLLLAVEGLLDGLLKIDKVIDVLQSHYPLGCQFWLVKTHTFNHLFA